MMQRFAMLNRLVYSAKENVSQNINKMKTLARKMVLALLTMTLCMGCSASRKAANNNYNNGGDTSRSFNLSGFSSVEQHGVANLTIIQTSGNYSIEVNGTPELVEATKVYIKNGILYINQDKSNVKGRSHLNVVISMPSLESIKNHGVGNISIAQLNQNKLNIESVGVGNVRIEKLNCNSLDIDNRGVGNITIGGKASDVTIDNRGVGNVNTIELDAENVSADNRGVGNIKCSVSGKFSASTRGVGSISYKGKPRSKNVTRSGLGSIKSI